MVCVPAVGHFHLYAWLTWALSQCTVSPEFPTGNGKIDIHIRCGEQTGLIEVKSFRDMALLKHDRAQAARYALSLSIPSVTIALFVPVEDEEVLRKLSGEQFIEGVRVITFAIGWV